MIYVYGLIPARELDHKSWSLSPGIDGKHSTTWIQHHDIVAYVCEVEATDFSQENVDRLIQNPIWLQEKGQHHHERIAELQREFTVIPMSFCTLFANETSLKRTLDEQSSAILGLFAQLAGHHEWSIKIYSDREDLKRHLTAHHEPILALTEELEQLPPGKKFLMKKKVEQQIDAIVLAEVETRWAGLHQQLVEVTARHQSKPTWSRAMTGRDDDMVYNGMYLVADEEIADFFAIIDANRASSMDGGWSIQCTGPWPPYHFAKLERED